MRRSKAVELISKIQGNKVEMCQLHQIRYICGHTKDIEFSPCDQQLQTTPSSQQQGDFRARAPKLPPGFFTNTFTILSDPLDRYSMHDSDELVYMSTKLATGKWGCENGVDILVQKPPPAGKKARRGDVCDECRAERSEWWGEGMSADELEKYLEENGGYVPVGIKEKKQWEEQKAREEERAPMMKRLNEEYRMEYGKGIWD